MSEVINTNKKNKAKNDAMPELPFNEVVIKFINA